MVAPILDDAFLVRQVLAGNRDAFRILVVRHERGLFRFLAPLAPSPAQTEELAQEAFLRAYRNLAEYDPREGAAFSTWLFTIARNLALNERARFSSQREVPDEAAGLDHSDASPTAEQQLENWQSESALRAAMARMPNEFRAAVSLSQLDELSLDEVAAIEKVSVGTIKSRIFRGKAWLREALLAGARELNENTEKKR